MLKVLSEEEGMLDVEVEVDFWTFLAGGEGEPRAFSLLLANYELDLRKITCEIKRNQFQSLVYVKTLSHRPVLFYAVSADESWGLKAVIAGRGYSSTSSLTLLRLMHPHSSTYPEFSSKT